jgi:hypothetical protein
MQYLIYDPDYSSSVPYRWSNNTDLKIIEIFPLYNISFFFLYTIFHFLHVHGIYISCDIFPVREIAFLTHLFVMVGYILHAYKKK